MIVSWKCYLATAGWNCVPHESPDSQFGSVIRPRTSFEDLELQISVVAKSAFDHLNLG